MKISTQYTLMILIRQSQASGNASCPNLESMQMKHCQRHIEPRVLTPFSPKVKFVVKPRTED